MKTTVLCGSYSTVAIYLQCTVLLNKFTSQIIGTTNDYFQIAFITDKVKIVKLLG